MVNAVPILDGLHEKFIEFCSRHGLKPGYHLTNQVMEMFEGRLGNWDQIAGTVSTFHGFSCL